MSIIKLEHINFYYDRGKPSEVHALTDVSIDINRGEYISFFGPSGCGKSTLLYIIAGVEKPDDGKVIINNQNLMDLSPKELAIYRQIGIGIIFQNFNLIPSIKNLENITLPMAFLGISPEKRKTRALEILDRLGIAQFADRYPYELSGGQQQRVAIARALANDPPIILADEPLGNLDSANANNVLDLLKEFNQQDGKIIIMVTHEAWSLRDVTRVYYMRDGAVLKMEDKKAEIEKKAFEKKKNNAGHPELPKVEARARTLAGMILRGYSQPEIKRLEYFLVQRFKDQIDQHLLMMVLDRPFHDGGVGLWKQKARKISSYIEAVIREERELERIYKQLEQTPEAPLYAEIEHIRNWLLKDFDVHLTPLQIDRLHETIGERLRNIITPDNFLKVLNLGKDRGGVGLKIRTSLRMAEKMEALLGHDHDELVGIQ